MTVDEQLKGLMIRLGEAINASLSESDRIAEAIGAIKHAGYDMFLVLEATISFNKIEDGPVDASASRTADGKPKFTQQDEQFLRAVKIDVRDI